MSGIVGLLLAAGKGRRFGGDKLSQHLSSGELVIERSLKHLAAATDSCLVLTHRQSPPLHSITNALGASLLEVPQAESGMGSTLAAGVQATSQAAGWVIALGDMPCIRPDTITSVVSALRDGASIVAPRHAGQRGHPVGFSRAWLNNLLALHGDTGARDVLKAHAADITCIEVNDPGCLLDIDTPEDLRHIEAAMKHSQGRG